MAKKRHNKKKTPKTDKPVTALVVEKPTEKKKLSTRFWVFLTGAIVLAGGALSFFQLRDYTKTSKEKFDDEYIAEGDLKPLTINEPQDAKPDQASIESQQKVINTISLLPDSLYYKDSAPPIKGIFLKDYDNKSEIYIHVGGNIFGWNPSRMAEMSRMLAAGYADEENFKIIAGINNNRLYLSMEFKDLDKEETIGWIDYNHWKLFKPNLL